MDSIIRETDSRILQALDRICSEIKLKDGDQACVPIDAAGSHAFVCYGRAVHCDEFLANLYADVEVADLVDSGQVSEEDCRLFLAATYFLRH